jgi:hypothetical protein
MEWDVQEKAESQNNTYLTIMKEIFMTCNSNKGLATLAISSVIELFTATTGKPRLTDGK